MVDKYPEGVYNIKQKEAFYMANECECRKTHRSGDEKKKLLNRISRIQGQIKAICRMIEDDVYCPDVIIQISAAEAALASLSREMLVSHINSCVLNDIREGKDGASEDLADLVVRLIK